MKLYDIQLTRDEVGLVKRGLVLLSQQATTSDGDRVGVVNLMDYVENEVGA